MASFFAAGGKKEGLLNALSANLSGVIWAMIIFFVLGAWHFKFAMAIIVLIAVIGMCVQAGWKVLSFIPDSFIGCGATFGNNFDWKATVIASIVGGVLGYLMELGANYIFKGFFTKKGAVSK
nr:DUF1097 domain-containing protein [Clostridium magnum]